MTGPQNTTGSNQNHIQVSWLTGPLLDLPELRMPRGGSRTGRALLAQRDAIRREMAVDAALAQIDALRAEERSRAEANHVLRGVMLYDPRDLNLGHPMHELGLVITDAVNGLPAPIWSSLEVAEHRDYVTGFVRYDWSIEISVPRAVIEALMPGQMDSDTRPNSVQPIEEKP